MESIVLPLPDRGVDESLGEPHEHDVEQKGNGCDQVTVGRIKSDS